MDIEKKGLVSFDTFKQGFLMEEHLSKVRHRVGSR